MTQKYNAPIDGDQSTIGNQIRTDHFQKKALVEAKKEQYFGQLADVVSMPKNMGKTIKRYHYLPLLDDANINDQGIDANGATTSFESTIVVVGPNGNKMASGEFESGGRSAYFVGNDEAAEADAIIAAKTKVAQWVKVALPDFFATLADGSGGEADYDEFSTTGGASLFDEGYRFELNDTVNGHGNLYGSSKDIGTISAKLPVLSETGGYVNRVGMTRVELEGSINRFGFYETYTDESLMFDSDSELQMHINREMVMGANEITEDTLQIDILNAAGVVRYGGAAAATSEVTGVDADGISTITYGDLMRLAIDLDNNRTPKHTKVITGTRMIDTKVIDGARIMYIGSELIPSVKAMTDLFDNPAFIPIQHYAAAGNTVTGEIGSIDQFRIVVVPEMAHWAGAGADEGTNAGYRVTNGKYDVFPMLVVGSESFTTIGFQTNGKTVKFKIKHSKPGSPESYAKDPYGTQGFMSIQWWYGFMPLRTERIALCKVVAPW